MIFILSLPPLYLCLSFCLSVCLSLSLYIYIYIYKDGCCRSKERIKIYSKIRRPTKRFVFFEFIHFILTYVCMFPACCFHQRTCVAQGLVNGVLNKTWTHSCLQFEWFLVGQAGFILGLISLFPYSVFTLVCFTLFDIWYIYNLCVCVCTGVGVVLDFANIFFISACVWVCHSYFNIYIYIYIYIYIKVVRLLSRATRRLTFK